MNLTLGSRRSTALALGALLLGSPILAACGSQNVATARPYVPAAAANDQSASVDVLGAVIVSNADGEGTFIASFANNNAAKDVDVTGISVNAPDAHASSSTSIPVAAGGLSNMSADNQGIAVSGTFKQGDFLPVTIAFSTGEQVQMQVPVVAATDEFAGLDTAGGSASPTSTPTS